MSTYVHCCTDMTSAIRNSEMPVQFLAKFREYGIDVLDGGTSTQEVHFCPWCGTRLPGSLRDEWFDQLEEQGIDPTDTAAVPEAFQDHRWYLDNT